MFESKESFIEWLRKNAAPGYAATFESLDDDLQHQVQQLFERHSGAEGSGDMLAISGTLGKATALFANEVKAAAALSEGSALKDFVIGSVVALFRLMDRGVSGGNKNVTGKQGGMIASMFPAGNMEDAFVRPLAEQATQQTLQTLGR